jgi:hypothetical protein
VAAAKHAAVMGADVRPATVEDVMVDQKARVFSTPGFLLEGARLAQVARAIDKLVRQVLSVTRDRSTGATGDQPAPTTATSPTPEARGPKPAPAEPNPADPIRRRPTGPARGSA